MLKDGKHRLQSYFEGYAFAASMIIVCGHPHEANALLELLQGRAIATKPLGSWAPLTCCMAASRKRWEAARLAAWSWVANMTSSRLTHSSWSRYSAALHAGTGTIRASGADGAERGQLTKDESQIVDRLGVSEALGEKSVSIQPENGMSTYLTSVLATKARSALTVGSSRSA